LTANRASAKFDKPEPIRQICSSGMPPIYKMTLPKGSTTLYHTRIFSIGGL
jgi:hypothetical protein